MVVSMEVVVAKVMGKSGFKILIYTGDVSTSRINGVRKG